MENHGKSSRKSSENQVENQVENSETEYVNRYIKGPFEGFIKCHKEIENKKTLKK